MFDQESSGKSGGQRRQRALRDFVEGRLQRLLTLLDQVVIVIGNLARKAIDYTSRLRFACHFLPMSHLMAAGIAALAGEIDVNDVCVRQSQWLGMER